MPADKFTKKIFETASENIEYTGRVHIMFGSSTRIANLERFKTPQELKEQLDKIIIETARRYAFSAMHISMPLHPIITRIAITPIAIDVVQIERDEIDETWVKTELGEEVNFTKSMIEDGKAPLDYMQKRPKEKSITEKIEE